MTVGPTTAPQSIQQVRSALKKIWGYDNFRPPQADIVQTLLQGTDTLVVMPTGGGKSLCFQLPALLQQGLTIVISPLVALMENQVRDLQNRRLPAALLHSELPKPTRSQILRAIDQQRLRLLYLSPETLLNQTVWTHLNQPHVLINGLILDEAHCLGQWGDTFRPAYRRLGTVRDALIKTQPQGKSGSRKPIAIAAFTATANPQDQAVIESVLNLSQPKRVRINPYRANLELSVQTVWTPQGRRSRLLNWIKAHPHQSGLVYVRSRQDTRNLSQWLTDQGYPATAYHAGLGAVARRQIEGDWIGDRIPIVVCTSAFGMGIDKPNCRWVVQFQAPGLLSEYVQEVGRAGRDGKRAEALTLVSEPTGWLDPQDKQRQQFLQTQQQQLWQRAQRLMKKLPQEGEAQTVSRQFKHGAIALSLLHKTGQLEWTDPFHYRILSRKKIALAKDHQSMGQLQKFFRTRGCRWQFILGGFGFTEDAKKLEGCGRCDRCRNIKPQSHQ
ncbi:MAG: RecQ family ATP-dependent DNA helicase [Cyanobacteria bacterium P01_F01_bin.150]